HVAVDPDRPLPHFGHVSDRAKGPPDEPLDLQRPSTLLALDRLSLRSLLGGARQHGILGGDPPPPLVLEEWWSFFLQRGRANDLGSAHLDQDGAFRVLGEVTGDLDRPDLLPMAAILP